MTFIKFTGLIGIIAPIFGLSVVLVATLLCGPGCGGPEELFEWGVGGSFSWSSNALSDLGVSEVASLFNYSLIITGILTSIFAIGFLKAYAKSALFHLGGVILIFGGGSLSLVGIFTKAHGAIHSYVSLGFFILFPIAMILVGIAFIRMNMQAKGYPSILAGIIALLVILGGLRELGMQWHLCFSLGFAVPEYLEALILGVWIVWMGMNLMRMNGVSLVRF